MIMNILKTCAEIGIVCSIMVGYVIIHTKDKRKSLKKMKTNYFIDYLLDIVLGTAACMFIMVTVLMVQYGGNAPADLHLLLMLLLYTFVVMSLSLDIKGKKQPKKITEKDIKLGLMIQMVVKYQKSPHERTHIKCPLCTHLKKDGLVRFSVCHIKCINYTHIFTMGYTACIDHKTYDNWLARGLYWSLMYNYMKNKPINFFNKMDEIKHLSEELDKRAIALHTENIRCDGVEGAISFNKRIANNSLKHFYKNRNEQQRTIY